MRLANDARDMQGTCTGMHGTRTGHARDVHENCFCLCQPVCYRH